MPALFINLHMLFDEKGRLSGLLAGLLLCLFLLIDTAHAATDLSHSYAVPTNQLTYYQENRAELAYPEALAHLRRAGSVSKHSILNFGLGSNPVWISFTVNNPEQLLTRYLQIENSWLDRVDVYLLHDGVLLQRARMGDKYPFLGRGNRFFALKHDFKPGLTTVLIRIETVDPQVLPIYLYTPDDYLQRMQNSGYLYGAIYGFLIALLIYNALLFFSLRSRRYLFYSLYLTTFIALNLAYTGHGFKWLWPELPAFQNRIIPLLMVAYALGGMLFARVFLELPTRFPRVNLCFNLLGGALLSSAIFFLLIDDVLSLLYTGFIGIIPFALLMIVAGAAACFAGVKEARYFLGAAIFAMLSAIITAFTVSGLVEYRSLGFHAVEYGMLLEAVLFALALAYQFRMNQEEKVEAQNLADRDQLTGLFNRRGFDKVMEPVFKKAFMQQRSLCLLVLDIDHFKAINDQHGHGYGDLVLADLAKVLKQEVRSDDLVARWGGEEFLLLLPDTNHLEAVTLAERLILNISNREVEGELVSCQYTVSIGISELKPPINSFKQLLVEADKYLYKAKETGRNRACYQ